MLDEKEWEKQMTGIKRMYEECIEWYKVILLLYYKTWVQPYEKKT